MEIKKMLGLLILALFSLAASGQHEVEVSHLTQDRFLILDEAPYNYLLADQVSLRACPSTDCELLGVLPIGSKMTLLEQSDSSLTIQGIRSHWYKVEAGKKTGWLWGGFIAYQAFGSVADPEVKFVGGYEKVIPVGQEDGGTYYQIRAFRDGKQLDKIVLKSFARGFSGLINLGSKGLPRLDDILQLHVPCVGGCGCLTGEMVVFWANGQFHHVINLTGTADAEYSEYVDFVYPADMEGEKGVIMKKSSKVGESKEDEEGNRKDYRNFTIEYLIWDGKKLVPSGRKPVKKVYLIDG